MSADEKPLSAVEEAYKEYRRRQKRYPALRGAYRPRPDGSPGPPIWSPSPEEKRECCDRVIPTGVYNHCKTLTHIARLYNVDEGELRILSRSRAREAFKEKMRYHKAEAPPESLPGFSSETEDPETDEDE